MKFPYNWCYPRCWVCTKVFPMLPNSHEYLIIGTIIPKTSLRHNWSNSQEIKHFLDFTHKEFSRVLRRLWDPSRLRDGISFPWGHFFLKLTIFPLPSLKTNILSPNTVSPYQL